MNQNQSEQFRILTDRFQRLFTGRRDAWGAEHGESLKQGVEQKNYFLHLIGHTPLGIYPLRDDGTCVFGAIDIDREDPQLVRKIYEELWNIGLKQVFIERSRSKGYHLWIFLSELVEARKIRWLLSAALNTLDIQAEVFPKQDALREGEIGNYINLPYVGGLKQVPERRVIIDPNTFEPIPLADFLDTADRMRVHPEVIEAILEELPPIPPKPEAPDKPRAIPDVDVHALHISDKVRKLILGDFNKGDREAIEIADASGQKSVTYPSRSEADEAIIASLLSGGYGDEVIFGVFEKYPTTGKYKEKGGRKDQYLLRSIANARRFVGEKEGAAFPSSSNGTRSKLRKGQGISIPMPSTVLRDGRIVEMLYDPKNKATRFAVFKDGELSYENSIPLSSSAALVPYSPRNNLIKNDVVLFPSEAEEYGSEENLLEEIKSFIYSYVDIPELFLEIACYYVLFSWIYDDFYELPYLRIIGDPGSGKSRFLRTVGSICNKPIFAGVSTASAIFRLLDIFRGTLIIDEGDFRQTDERAEITKVLNNGFARGFSVVKVESTQGKGKEFSPRSFNVFSPKIIATREYFADTALESRCITFQTDQKQLRDDIPINLTDEHREQARRLRNKLLMFRFRNLGKRRAIPNLVDRSIEPRLNQVFIPLLSVIEDEQTRNKLKNMAREYHKQIVAERGMTTEAQILSVIKELIELREEPSMKDIARSFVSRHGEEFERRITPKWVGSIIRKKLKLKPEKRETGFVIPLSEAGKLTGLYEKYGLLDTELPHSGIHKSEDPFII